MTSLYAGCLKESELLKEGLPYGDFMSVLSLMSAVDAVLKACQLSSSLTPARYMQPNYTRMVNTLVNKSLAVPELLQRKITEFRILWFHEKLPDLIELANHTPQLGDAVTVEEMRLAQLEDELVAALGKKMLSDLLIYRISLIVNPAVWKREKTQGMPHDFDSVERESLKFIRAKPSEFTLL